MLGNAVQVLPLVFHELAFHRRLLSLFFIHSAECLLAGYQNVTNRALFLSSSNRKIP